MTCETCLKNKSTLQCGICQANLCKGCAEFVETEFQMMTTVPKELSLQVYCHQCYGEKIVPQLEIYNEISERAREVQIYFKDQGKETRLLKRTEKPLRILDCKDYDESLLRLAYLAAEKGFDTLIDVDVTSKKVRQDTYQLTIWSVSGVPTMKRNR